MSVEGLERMTTGSAVSTLSYRATQANYNVVPGFNEYAKELHTKHDLVFLHGNHSESQELVLVIQICANRGSDLKVC